MNSVFSSDIWKLITSLLPSIWQQRTALVCKEAYYWFPVLLEKVSLIFDQRFSEVYSFPVDFFLKKQATNLKHLHTLELCDWLANVNALEDIQLSVAGLPVLHTLKCPWWILKKTQVLRALPNIKVLKATSGLNVFGLSDRLVWMPRLEKVTCSLQNVTHDLIICDGILNVPYLKIYLIDHEFQFKRAVNVLAKARVKRLALYIFPEDKEEMEFLWEITALDQIKHVAIHFYVNICGLHRDHQLMSKLLSRRDKIKRVKSLVGCISQMQSFIKTTNTSDVQFSFKPIKEYTDFGLLSYTIL